MGKRLCILLQTSPHIPVCWLFPVQGWSRVRGKETQPRGSSPTGAGGTGLTGASDSEVFRRRSLLWTQTVVVLPT